MKVKSSTIFVAILALGSVGFAQGVFSDVAKATKATGRVTEKTAKKTAQGTAKAAKKTAHGGEKAVSETGRGTEKVATKTADAVK